MCAATANPSRTYIPDEYHFTGVSMNCRTPANSTMRSSFAAISRRRIPRIAPLRKTFSRPVSSGWNPGPDFDQRGDPAVNHDAPARRRRDAREQFEQRALAGAVAADHADRRSAEHVEAHILQAPRTPGVPARAQPVLLPDVLDRDVDRGSLIRRPPSSARRT